LNSLAIKFIFKGATLNGGSIGSLVEALVWLAPRLKYSCSYFTLLFGILGALSIWIYI